MLSERIKVNNYIIRTATITDIDEIERVMKQSMQLLGAGYYNERQIKSACQYVCVPDRQIIEDGTYYVVEDESGAMIGCGGWSFRNTLYAGPQSQFDHDILVPSKDMARIRAMFVLPSASGKGVGALILNFSEAAAKKYGFKKGALGATESGLDFYKAKQWIVVKKEMAALPDGVKIEITHMEKEFSS